MIRVNDVKRLSQTADALAKHGLSWLAKDLGLLNQVSILAGRHATLSPETAAGVLQELGGGFAACAHFISKRPDLAPAAWREAFARVATPSAPLSNKDVHAVVEQELGRPIRSAFASFNHHPLRVTQTFQLHQATIGDTSVLVKVQNPHAAEAIRQDAALIAHLAERAKLFQRIAGEFEAYAPRLLDYAAEGDVLTMLADAGVNVPRVDHASQRLLVAHDVESSGPAPEGPELARQLLEQVLTGVIKAGVVSIPDAAHIRIGDGGLGFAGLGDAQLIEPPDRKFVADLLSALGNPDALTRVLARNGGDPALLRDSIKGKRSVSQIIAATSRHAPIPSSLALVGAALDATQQLGRTFDPMFDVTSQAPHVVAAIKR